MIIQFDSIDRDRIEDGLYDMSDDEERNQPESEDLIGDEISSVSISPGILISRKSEKAGCLCYVYAGVLRTIGIILGATAEKDDRPKRNGPGKKERIESMIDALNEIRGCLRDFKRDKNRKGCPEKYHARLAANIDYLIPKLQEMIIYLKGMKDLFNRAKIGQELDELDEEQFKKASKARDLYRAHLETCCDNIEDINKKIVWWREDLLPISCMDQQATG
jgi:hypothetical protein